MKIIKVESCQTCPFRIAGPAKAKIAMVPKCNKAGKDLPYVLTTKARKPTAAATNKIPEWCPLGDDNE